MRPVTSIDLRIRERAYYLYLNGSTAGHLADWCAAAKVENALATRRIRDAARRADKRNLRDLASRVPAGWRSLDTSVH